MISNLSIKGYKAFKEKRNIPLSNLTLLFGGNSSGKSTTIQTLMLLKQTYESRYGDYNLLLNGRYTTLGSSEDIFNQLEETAEEIELKLDINNDDTMEFEGRYTWAFKKNAEFRGNRINDIYLDRYELETNQRNYRFSSKGEKLINSDVASRIKEITIEKIVPLNMQISYNENANSLLLDFFDQLFELANDKKSKIVKWNKNKDFYRQIQKVYEAIIQLLDNNGEEQDENKIEKKLTNTQKEYVIKILKNMEALMNSLGVMEYTFLNKLINIDLLNLVAQKTDLKEICENFEKKTKKVLEEKPITFTGKRDLSIEVDRLPEIEGIEILTQSKNSLEKILNHIYYIGPVREKPKSVYEYATDIEATYVGVSGEYLPGVLNNFKNQIIDVPLPNNNMKSESCSMIEALNEWMSYLGLIDKVMPGITDNLTIAVEDHGINAKLINVGVGISQVLPVLLMGLLSPKDSILIFEQPELHLHPFAQSKLIDFFVALIKNGKQIIIETHSEYFLHRLRYLILAENINQDMISLLFFSKNKKGVTVKKAMINESGDFDYPPNYKDVTEELINDILDKTIERM